MDFLEMTKNNQDEHYKSTLNLLKKFIESNQRIRIKLLSDIEFEFWIFSTSTPYICCMP